MILAPTNNAQSYTYRHPQELPQVLEQYLEAAFLYTQRQDLISGPSRSLQDNMLLDLRIDSLLDGLRVSPNPSAQIVMQALEEPSPELLFLTCILTLESKNTPRLKQLLALAETDSDLQKGLLDAFSWVPLSFTQPLIPHLLAFNSTFFRQVGLHLYRQHQIHADTEFERAITQQEPSMLACALQAVGEVGMLDLLPHCLALLNHERADIRFMAARSCAMLGERERSLAYLRQIALEPGSLSSPLTKSALALLAAFMPLPEAHLFLSSLASQNPDRRLLIHMAGELGDPASVPALLRLMQDKTLSRLAAHAFCIITGLDLVENDLEQAPPEDLTGGPNDDPDDDAVDSDPDEDLPWPNQQQVAAWWTNHGSAFKAGSRYLAGKQATQHNCLAVLEHGCQAQRRAAALQLKAISPSSPLFLLDAPAWRQAARLKALIASV